MSIKLTKLRAYLFLAIVGLFLLTANRQSFGQDTNASLTGTVTDPSGAAIPGAKLTLTNKANSQQTTFESDSSGAYNFRNLPPGMYDLAVTAPNFQSSNRTGIQLALAQSARVDVALTLGQSDQTVTVNADASLLNYETPSLEGGVSPETLQSFPLVISGAPRSSVTVAILMPGVSTGGSGNAYNARTNGGIVTGDEALVDGATASEGYMNQSGMVALQTDFGMSPDITSEVKIEASNYGPQYGNSTSGQLIIQTKSGGEKFHGAAYEYIRNDLFNATQYGLDPDKDTGKVKKPADKENDFGANIGGPIWIPGYHSADARVKGYFYFNWEGFQNHGSANSSTLSIAPLAERNGDFSSVGSQLYYPNDPAKYGANAGKAIPNNQIDPQYADPVAAAFLAALPAPTNGDQLNNYFIPRSGQGSLTNSENVYFWRVDMNVGQKDHFYYTYWWQYTGVNEQSDLPLALSTAQPAKPENAPIQRFNWEHNFSSYLTNHATVGYLNRNEGYFALNGKASLPVVPGVANPTYLPEMAFGGGYSQLGSSAGPDAAANVTTRGTWAVNDVATFIRGKHTITAGLEWKLAGTSIHSSGNQGGTFTFNQDTTGNAGCASSCPGDAIASFYLGAAAQAEVAYLNVTAKYPRQIGWAFHAGDSWRINPKLILTYGLRWDYISPFVDKHNNLSFIDPYGPNPDAVRADGSQLNGRLAFAGTKFGAASYGGRYPEQAFKNAFAPRVGFAYTLNQKTVVRAGYGIYFGQAFYPGWGGGLAQDGFNKNLILSEATSGNFKTPAIYLQSGIAPAQVGSTSDISAGADNGLTPSLYRPRDGNHRPYSSQWNLTVERQLPSNTLFGLSYVGTKGTHLPSGLSPINTLNPFNSSILGLGADLAVDYNTPDGPATFAKDGISPPYIGWADQIGQAQSCQATIAQALLPFPQYCGPLLGLNEQHGTSIYHSLQAKLERRFQGGLYILGSLTWQKMFTDAANNTQSQNASNAGSGGNSGSFSPFDTSHRAYAVAPDNVPVTGSVAIVYDLPFGRNKRFLNGGGLLNTVVGGWQTSPIYRYEYGTPFSFYDSADCTTNKLISQFRENCVPAVIKGQKALLQDRNSFDPAKGALINIAALEHNFSTFGYTGTGRAVSDVYGPSYKNIDIAFTKNTRIAEKFNFRFEANFFNAFNNHYFVNQGASNGGTPYAFYTDLSATTTDANNNPVSLFGKWNKSVSTPRTIQFVGRFEF